VDDTGAASTLDDAATLPWDWYADPATLERERDRIFGRSWQYAGHRGELDEATLRAVRPSRIDTWGPFVFVNADPDAAPLEQALGELPAVVAESGVDLDALVHHSRTHSSVAANWKVVAENFLECYHCPTAHPSFSDAIDVRPGEYLLEAHDRFWTQYAHRRGNGADEVKGQFHLLFPGVVMNIMPGRPNLSIGPILPHDAETTTRFLDYFFGPDVEEQWIAQMLELDGQVGSEDVALVESVQRGIRTGAVERGRLLLGSEHLIAGFQRAVLEAVS
jgi:choline monooxygenase